MQLSIVARRLATWRRAVEELTGKGRSDNAD
jgi:hypothetical protein